MFTLDRKIMSQYKSRKNGLTFKACASAHFVNLRGQSFVAFALKENEKEITYIKKGKSGVVTFSVLHTEWSSVEAVYNIDECVCDVHGYKMQWYRPMCLFINRKALYNFFMCASRLCTTVTGDCIVSSHSSM